MSIHNESEYLMSNPLLKTNAEIIALIAERDLRYYDETRIAYKSAHVTAGDVLRDLNRPMHLDADAAEKLADAIREFVLPHADDATRLRLYETLRDCPRAH